METPAETRAIVLVSGMHRSGTSAFTRVCNLLGGALPEPLVAPAVGNELGHWEPAPVVAMNDRALLAAGGEVNSVFPVSPAWRRSRGGQGFVEEVEAYAGSLRETPSAWFVKDPRISVLADLWRDGVARSGSKPRFVIAFRNPWEVATSLSARQLKYFPAEVWPIERGLALWLNYTLAAERHSRGCPRSFVAFEDFLEDWRGEIGRVYHQIGLAAPSVGPEAEAAIEAFLQPEERHARHDAIKTRAGLAMHVYALLQARKTDPDGGAAAFDKARETFERSFEVLGGYVSALEGRAAAVAEVETLRRQVKSAELRLAHLSRNVEPALKDGGSLDADAFNRLKLQHTALKSAHRENVAAFKAEQARWRDDLATAAEQHGAETRALVSAREADRRRLEAEAQRAASALAEKDIALADKDRELADKDRELADKDRALALIDPALAERDEAMAASDLVARHQIALAQAETERLQAEITALRRSRSWRLTAPVRAVMRRLGRG